MAAHADSHGHPHVHLNHPAHQHHFETMEQQAEAATLGMWLFLVTEVMFFGGLLMAYLLYRVWYPQAWSEGSLELDIVLGGTNTVVLIGSSLTMALAVRAAQTDQRRASIIFLIVTMLLGLTFLVIKFFEYKHKFDTGHVPGPNFHFEGPNAGQVEIFMSLYFGLTGLHALHMIIGFGIMSVILWMTIKNRFSHAWYTPVELAGLYWHLVDLVWIYLFPLLYLI
jgi:cytochrome c oxidase subunit 3